MKFLDDKELNIVSGGHAWNPWHSSTIPQMMFPTSQYAAHQSRVVLLPS